MGLRAARDLLPRLRRGLSARLWALRAARPRRRLRAAVPALRGVTFGPTRLYGRTVGAYTAAGAADADLERVCALLEGAGVPYFLVPAEHGHGAPRRVVGVEETYRGTVLAEAAQCFAGTAGYVGAVGPDGTVTTAVLWADGGLPRTVRQAAVLRTGLVRLGPAAQILTGLDTGCDIEFWHYGHDPRSDSATAAVPVADADSAWSAGSTAPAGSVSGVGFASLAGSVAPAGAASGAGFTSSDGSASGAGSASLDGSASGIGPASPVALPSPVTLAPPASSASPAAPASPPTPTPDPPHLTVPGARLVGVFGRALVAPRRNAVSEVLPVVAREPVVVVCGDRSVPTFAPFAEPGIDEVLFPVDAVYTWVDGDDPAMAAKRRAHLERSGNVIAARETGASRYTSHDELRYALRSLEMYGGFVRHVFLVTDSQVPAWLDPDARGLTVVDHRDILPADALPVFNSHAIESRLHHIPGLSEHYLYVNDDVFINRPVRAEHFFHGNGIARIPLSPLKIGVGPPHPLEPAPNSAGKNTREAIRRFHGRHITHKSLHTPHPQLLSVMWEMESLGIEELLRTTYSRFRSTSDVAPASTLHHHWAIASGRAVPADYRFRYVQLGTPDMRRRLARLAAGEDVDFFCLNDVETTPSARAEAQADIHAFLEQKYPFPSRFEGPPRPTA
ncbi:stealth family protein [Streptomyces sp. NPDC048297]|uniref:stealth family protein n=1 Tax=Streptomyces sp. NPDC048297 TaxID=3365531 RepID=UPI003716B780